MAKAKGSGRKKGGWMRVRKTREVKPDGAHAYTWTYQAKIADALAEKRDRERTAQAAREAAEAAETARAEKVAAAEAAEARRQAQLAPRPCLRCGEMLPPEAFERHGRAYNGRMGACRPCAEIIRNRKAAPLGRREKDKCVLPPRPCRRCEAVFTPAHHNVQYCSKECRRSRQAARHAEQHREAYQADRGRRREQSEAWKKANPDKCRQYRRKAYHLRPEAEKEAHALWVARNRVRVNAYQRQFWHKCNADRAWRVQSNAAHAERRQRRQAINAAKSEFAGQQFLLLRARSGFWRGAAAGQAIGRTETVMARYDWETETGRGKSLWCVRAPAIATEAVQQVAARLRRGEQRAICV